MCLLDDEDTVVPGTMRATGDWVHVRDAQLCYLGRRDRLIKRHGKRVNLDSLQQVSIWFSMEEVTEPLESSRATLKTERIAKSG